MGRGTREEGEEGTRATAQRRRIRRLTLIVDTNVLFSYFKKDSLTNKLIEKERFSLIAPRFALEELEKHKETIMIKSRISDKEYTRAHHRLQAKVRFIGIEHYTHLLREARVISPDEDDVDFFALAIKERKPLWTNDKKLQEQNTIPTVTTRELYEFFKSP